MFYRQLLDAARADAGIESATLAAYTPLALLDTRGAARGDRGLRAAPRRRPGVPVEHRRPRLLPHAADPARRPAGSSRIATTRRRRRWRSSTTRSRNDSGAARRTRSASGSASATASGGRSIGVAADVKYSRINEAPRPYVYLPFLQVVSLEHDPAHARRRRRSTRSSTRRARTSRRSTPTCRSCTRRPLAEQIARRAASSSTSRRRCCSSSAWPAWRWPRWAPTGWCRTPSSRARTRSASAWRSARPALSVVRGFLGRGLRLGAIGAALGIVAALGVSRLLGSVLFGVSATDAMSFARALAIVLGGVVVATLVPSNQSPSRAATTYC